MDTHELMKLAIAEAVLAALNDEPVSDFMESFEPVMKIIAMKLDIATANIEVGNLERDLTKANTKALANQVTIENLRAKVKRLKKAYRYQRAATAQYMKYEHDGAFKYRDSAHILMHKAAELYQQFERL
jgi:hypothetical protein